MTKLGSATIALSLLVLLPAKNAFAQAADPPYQVGIMTNDLTRSDTLLAFTNDGASGGSAPLCVSVYAMSGNGTAPSAVSACCTCKVQQNGFVSVSVNTDVLASVVPKPKNAVVKLLASVPVAGACSASAIGALANGMVAVQGAPQSTQFGAPGTPYIPFTPSTLSAAELSRLTTQCTNFSARTCNAACNP
jgi:hypothetical protein